MRKVALKTYHTINNDNPTRSSGFPRVERLSSLTDHCKLPRIRLPGLRPPLLLGAQSFKRWIGPAEHDILFEAGNAPRAAHLEIVRLYLLSVTDLSVSEGLGRCVGLLRDYSSTLKLVDGCTVRHSLCGLRLWHVGEIQLTGDCLCARCLVCHWKSS